jgi:hypothetical protein
MILLSAGWYTLSYRLRGAEKNAYFRMALDFTFVFLTLVASAAPAALESLLTVMPIINQHNHSVRKKPWHRSFIFFCLWALVFFYCLHQVGKPLVLIWYAIFCALIVFIDWLDCYIKRISEDIDRLTSQVLDVTDNQNGISHLLKKFAEVLNGNSLFKCVKDLYLVEVVKDRLLIRAGSYFDPRIVFSVDTDVRADLGKRLAVSVKPTPSDLFNGSSFCRGFFFEREQRKYLFVVVFVESSSFTSVTSLFLWQLLNRSVPNIIRIYRRRQDERAFARKTREDFIKNSQYIASVRAAAHYIRNNINLFVTVSEMITAFFDNDNAASRTRLSNINKQLIVKQRHIQEYVAKILDSPRKDVFAEDFQIVNASTLFKSIIQVVEENAESKIEVKYLFDNLKIEDIEVKIKRLNFSVLLENLIRNAVKHSDGSPVVKCLLQGSGFRIEVSNKIRPACLSSVQQFIGDLTSSSKEEIIKRKGEGLLLIRNTCDNLNAKVQASLSSTNDEVFISITLGEYHEQIIFL